ncbi:MAG: TIGR02253 family HAD-type hydrolase [Planctomycetota bacterium]
MQESKRLKKRSASGGLKAVLFDIDDTLYSTSEFAARARRNSVSAMIKTGLRLPHPLVMKELVEVINEFSSNYEHHFDKLLLRLPRNSYRTVNPIVLVASAVIAYHETKFKELVPFADVPSVLKKIAQTRLTLGIISAGLEIKQSEKLIRLKLYKFFHPKAIFISDQIGINKPNPKLYRRVCADLKINPSQVMYIGDNPVSDIDPANQIGMITVLVRRKGKHYQEAGLSRPDYVINNFQELWTILKKEYL